jgi:hypothetical protein
MKRLLTLTLTILALSAPAALLAEAHPAGSSAHMRPVLFHDRSPRPHVHNVLPHH